MQARHLELPTTLLNALLHNESPQTKVSRSPGSVRGNQNLQPSLRVTAKDLLALEMKSVVLQHVESNLSKLGGFMKLGVSKTGASKLGSGHCTRQVQYVFLDWGLKLGEDLTLWTLRQPSTIYGGDLTIWTLRQPSAVCFSIVMLS